MTPNALPPRATAWLLALVAALLLLRLGAAPLLGPDEPRYARVAVEMQRAGEWLRPTLAGEPWLEKPPLYYWLAGAAYGLLGENELAARLPAAGATLALVASTALFGARLFGPAAGLQAGLVLGTALLPFLFGKVATMDALLAACVTASTGLLGLRYLGIAGPLAVPAAYAFAALAVLAKGALGLLPGLVALGYVLLRRDARAFRESLSPAGMLLFLAIAAPWHLLVLRDQGQAFLDVYVLNHNLARFTSEIHRHPGSPLYYLPVILAGLFPWSGLLVPAAAALRPRSAPAELFVLLWFLLPLGLISAAGSKLPGYVLPCLPPLAILMGRTAEAMAAGAVSGGLRRLASLVTLVLGALLAAAPFLLARQGEPAWRAALPLGGWALTVAFLFSRRSERDPRGALALLRVGAPGLLVLLMLAAPEMLARRESGRILFLPARGRPVLAWGAWRTAWMSGYFYNDGRVRWIGERRELDAALSGGPTLVVCGPRERDVLEADPGIQLAVLATGPRGNVLVRLDRR